MSPRPWLAMKLMASGVTRSAAMVRSPSFSRSWSSTTTTNLPARMFSMAWATEMWGLAGMDPFDEASDLFGDHVGFEVDTAAGAKLAEESDFEGVRDEQNSNDEPSTWLTVRLTPSMAMEPFLKR
jgi:hypothetical protein